MKLIKESLNFERGLSDREIKTKLVGFRKGQILISVTFRIYIFIELLSQKLFPIRCLSIGLFNKNKGIVFDNQFSIVGKSIDSLRITNNEESHKIIKVIKDPKNQEYINKIKETLGFTPFI
ncbi:MAG: hypothetical protein PHF86_00900 [Candidatus Nanoarchaeia archaeon]|nr:hypothetical protein [Candidatus Nanoarchaeia archaeon]